MGTTKKVIRVFVSCCPGLKKEHESVYRILRQLKSEWKKKHVLLKYNSQLHRNPIVEGAILNEYDIFVGAVWTKLSEDGDPENSSYYNDFKLAYSRHASKDHSARVMFFIKDYPIPPSKINANDLKQIHDFLKPIRFRKTVCTFYYDRDEFTKLVRAFLTRQLNAVNECLGNRAPDLDRSIINISHVIYRLTHNTDSIEKYLVKLTRLLNHYFESSMAKVVLLKDGGRNIRYVASYNGKASTLTEEISSISEVEDEIIKGSVVSRPRVIGYPMFFTSQVGAVIVERDNDRKAFKSCHRKLLSFIAEQAALGSSFFLKGQFSEMPGSVH